MNFDASGRARMLRAYVSAVLGTAAFGAAMPVVAAETGSLEEIVVTAQRRETNLQTTAVAITAYTGEMLADQKVFTVGDLANDVPSFSLTAGTPLDVELNIRGITNTRLDSPTSDPSVGTFIDGVYAGRTGDLNYDFYDLERVEIIRGPQGVLLGKNVVGGALSVTTAKPTHENSGSLTLSYGNYASKLVSGFVNGEMTEDWAGRFSFQYRGHDGFARDVLHNRDVENLESYQARGQVLWTPADSKWKARFMLEYNKDSTNGINVVAVDGGTTNCESTYLRTNCTRPWSNLRRFLGLTNPRQNIAQSIQYAGDPRINQYMKREGLGGVLDIQWSGASFDFNSLTAYRWGFGDQVYDQTGAGPEALNWDVSRFLQFVSFVGATRPAGNGSNGALLFAQPVGERATIHQFSQEFRLTSNTQGKLDWIAGLFLKRDSIDKNDRFIGENFLGAITPLTAANPLSTLSGQSNWYNDGNIKNFAVFGQIGWKFTDSLKLSAGLRYTTDKKDGAVRGLVVATGDRFNPNDPRANVTIESLCRRPDGSVVSPTPVPAGCVAPNRWTYQTGDSFQTAYGRKWNKMTPQATLEWTINPDVFTYLTVSRGFKGGGFDDTPQNPAQATTPFNPETATNYEIGIKTYFLDRRIRLNADVFYMDYKDLQVTQTNAACLCNLTDNAAKAKIKGVEAEFEWKVADGLRVNLGGSYVDPKYKDFLESATIPGTNPPQRLNSSNNRLQRTPNTQLSGGFDWGIPVGSMGRALSVSVNYSWQSDMYWATDNIAKEPSYGTLDARIGFAPQGKNWSVAAWGKNVTDELYRTNIISFFGEEVSQFGPPRTYGVDFSYRF
jgi:iron complex outermembrane receptor protein